jgi:hypothetical protein
MVIINCDSTKTKWEAHNLCGFPEVDFNNKKRSFFIIILNEVWNIVTWCETYSFSDGCSKYHQIFIVLKDIYKTTFVTNWGVFIWKVMPFGVNNGPPTFQKVVIKAFRKYLDNFMYDFTTYSDIETHLQKFRLCFQKWREYKINLNP